MRSASLAHAKAHLSELVDEAEHRGKRIMILRHGKPAAAIVPVNVVLPKRRGRRLGDAEIRTLFADLARYDDPNMSAVADLHQSRR